MNYRNTVNNKNPNINSHFISNSDRAELTSLKNTLFYVNENLSQAEVNEIIKNSVDDKGDINKAHAIELAFTKKIKQQEDV
jgi:uncharacterized protein YeeX (DUF496 family)